jgi:tetratricopeptide (TPR) repeat protein
MHFRTYGLSDGCSFELESIRSGNTPEFLRRLSARIAGPADRVRELGDEVTTLGAVALTDEEYKNLVECARHKLRAPVWDVAVDYAELALAKRPNDVDARFILAVALGAKGESSRAEQILREVVERQPDNHDAWYNLGVACATTGDHPEAIRCFEAALRVSPKNHAALYQLGCSREATGDHAAALEAYNEALGCSPNPKGAWHYTGMDFTEPARKAIGRLTKA